MKTICLNMIVKDERDVILRCLTSVRKLIDWWVIVDTGSSDGTRGVILEFLRDIPGELYERPWVDFAHNRNEALDLARGRGDYLLFIDADERLRFEEGVIDKNRLVKDFYAARVRDSATIYLRILLIRDHPGWVWRGALHESLTNATEMRGEVLPGVFNESDFQDGHRAKDPEKYQNDIAILKNLIAEDPADARNYYYLGQTYLGARDYPMALQAFERGASIGGNHEDVFWSLFLMSRLQQVLGAPLETFIANYCKTYLFDPSRAEPLFRLAEYFCDNDAHLIGYLVAKFALGLPPPLRSMRQEGNIYDYGILLTFALCADRLGKIDDARDAINQLLKI